MSTIADLRPGALGFGPIDGLARWPVWAGQAFIGEGFTVGPLKIEHVFVVTRVQPHIAPTPGNEVSEASAVEAMPNGAREVPIYDRWTPEYAYVQLPEDYPGQGEDVAAIARAMIGTPYSFASYPALAAWHWGLKAKRLEAWIGRRTPYRGGIDLSDDWFNHAPIKAPILTNGSFMDPPLQLPREAICSVLADQAWALTGKQVMPLGTPHQCVTPGALGAALLEMDGARWLWPGRS